MMKGLVIVSFSDVVHGAKVAGETIDVPPGVDWVKAGFVRLLPEAAAISAPEQATIPTARKRKPRTKTKKAGE